MNAKSLSSLFGGGSNTVVLALALILSLGVFSLKNAGADDTALLGSTAHPDWNPDGSSLLVAHAEPGAEEKVLHIDLNGAVLSHFNFSVWRETYPAYAPDGREFAFITLISEPEQSPRFTISIHNFENETTQVVIDEGSAYEPRFSPDHDRLVYSVARDGRRGIALLELSTMEESWVYEGAGVGFPSWSPDGASILFNKKNAVGFFEIMKLDLTTKHSEVIISSAGNAFYGHYSPSGDAIVYMSDETDPGTASAREIYVKSLQDGSTLRLTHNHQRDGYPKWSPDGERIAWHSGKSNAFAIAVMDLKSDAITYIAPKNPTGGLD